MEKEKVEELKRRKKEEQKKSKNTDKEITHIFSESFVPWS